MKVAVVLLCLLPVVFSAKLDDKRFIESLLGGYDILDLAKQLLTQFGTDETEAQCEATMCPSIVDKIDGHNALITGLLCGAVCKEAQVLSQNFAPASGNKRFIESLLGGYDILDLAKQLLTQFGTDETEAQCEQTLCPQILDKIDGHNPLITGLVCSPVCKEAQVLSQNFAPAGGKKRFIESLLGGYDILDLAKQLLTQFGTDETEAQCEQTLCPQILDKIDGHNPLITGLVCSPVCKEAQVLSQNFAPAGGKKRFIESLLGGYDILDLAKQLLTQFGTDETEAQCEQTLCPQILDKIDGHNPLITGLVCSPVCKEAQVLSQNFAPAGGKKRFIESLLGGYDILDLAKQLLTQFGTDETEAQCEQTLCPQILDKIDGHNPLITGLVCSPVCKEAQVLSQNFAPAGGKKRFIESLLGGYDILDLAKQLLTQFGTDETEAQCEQTLCPQILDKIDGHNPLITGLVCSPVCKEAQVLSQNFAPAAGN